MKIFYFQRVKEIKELKTTISVLSKANRSMTEELSNVRHDLSMLTSAFDTLKKDKTSITRKCNKYKKENEELKNKIAELASDKYLVRKIPSGRTPKSMEMKVKSNATNKPQVRKILKEKNEI